MSWSCGKADMERWPPPFTGHCFLGDCQSSLVIKVGQKILQNQVRQRAYVETQVVLSCFQSLSVPSATFRA